MDGARDFEDWEILQTNDTNIHSPPDSDDKSISFDQTNIRGDRVMKPCNFAHDSERQPVKKAVQEDKEPVPGSEFYEKGDLGHERIKICNSKSAAYGLNSEKFSPVGRDVGCFGGKDDIIHGACSNNEMGVDGIEKLGVGRDDSVEFRLNLCANIDTRMGTDGKEELQNVAAGDVLDPKDPEIGNGNSEIILDSSGNDSIPEKSAGITDGSEMKFHENLRIGDEFESSEGKKFGGECSSNSANPIGEAAALSSVVESGDGAVVDSVGEGKKKEVRYKLPLDLLKFCIHRIGPVWSVSVLVAMVGFVILRKSFYKTKRKSRSIPLKVSYVDKKISQITVLVSRPNESLSLAKRVPIIRSSVAGNAGATHWPAMSLK